MVLHTTTKLLAMFGQSLQEQGISKSMRIGLAVSGGPDSLALAFLAAIWAPKAGAFPFASISANQPPCMTTDSTDGRTPLPPSRPCSLASTWDPLHLDC